MKKQYSTLTCTAVSIDSQDSILYASGQPQNGINHIEAYVDTWGNGGYFDSPISDGTPIEF